MKLFVHLAIDRYGAECLGKFSQYISDIQNNEECHLYVWAGIGEPPVRENIWSDEYPTWEKICDFDNHKELNDCYPIEIKYDAEKHCEMGFTLDRQAMAKDVYNSLCSDENTPRFHWLFSERPNKLWGHDYCVSITICGSLADSCSSAILLGLIPAIVAIKNRIGVNFCAPGITGIISTGHASGTNDANQAKVRSLLVQGLLDMEKYFIQCKEKHINPIPIYIAGEELWQDRNINISTRSDQVATGATIILAISRNILNGNPEVIPGEDNRMVNNPFYFNINLDGKIQYANSIYDPQKPFAAVNMYAVHYTASRLARLLAVKFCTETLSFLRNQNLVKEIQDCAKIEIIPQVKSIIDATESFAIDHLWQKLIEPENIPWKRNNKEEPSWFSMELIELLYKPVFKTREWELLIKYYANSRFIALHPQDWNGALEELKQAVEGSFLPWRKRQVRQLTRRTIIAMMEGLDSSMVKLFQKTYNDPIRFEPHHTAQALLGQIYRKLLNQFEVLKTGELFVPSDVKDTLATKWENVKEKQKAINDELSDVANPVAVILRIIPTIALFAGIFLVLPFDLKWLNASWMRLLSGSILGIGISACFFFRYVSVVKKRLLKLFEEWFDLYKAVIAYEDEVLRKSAYEELLKDMIKCVEWYFNGCCDGEKQEKPPIPEFFAKTDSPDEPEKQHFDKLSSQQVLSETETYINDAVTAFNNLQTDLINKYQFSQLEMNIPDINVKNNTLEEVYSAILGLEANGSEDVKKDKVMHFMQTLINELNEKNSLLVPFQKNDEAGTMGDAPAWRRSFRFLDGADLMDKEKREQSSAYHFVCAVKDYLTNHYLGSKTLTQYCKDCPEEKLDELKNHYLNACHLPDYANNGLALQYVISASTNNQLSANNEMGCEKLSTNVQVRPFLCANDIIYFPNQEQTVTMLGKAWAIHLRTPYPEKAFQPVDIIGGMEP